MTTRSGEINRPILILGAVGLIGIGVVFGSVLGWHGRGHVTDTSTETTSTETTSTETLARIFRFDTLNSSLAYVEHTLRPAKYVNGDVRSYIVDDQWQWRLRPRLSELGTRSLQSRADT